MRYGLNYSGTSFLSTENLKLLYFQMYVVLNQDCFSQVL